MNKMIAIGTRKKFMLLVLVCMISIHALTGCTYLRELVGLGITKPQVKVTALEVSRATFTAIELAVAIRVYNPNNFDLNFSRVRYEMHAADLKIAAGSYDKDVSILADGYTSISLPIAINTEHAVVLAKRLLTSPSDIYAVFKATADFKTPFGTMEVSFEDKRSLSKMASL